MTDRPPFDTTSSGLYCGAKKRQSEGYCRKPAGWATEHVGIGTCKFHLGRTRNHVVAAEAELVRRAADTYGTPRDVPPRQGILEEIARTAGHVYWIGQQVAELEPGTAHSDPWIDRYQWERKHFADVCEGAEKLHIADQEIQLARQHGQLIADVLRAVLGDPELGLTAEQRRAVPAVARRHLALA